MRRFAIAATAILLALPAWAQQNGLPPDPRGAARLDARERQTLATVARNAATAQQLGSLANNRMGDSRLGQLGQSMAVTNSSLGQHLTRLAGVENLPLRERIDRDEIQRLQGIAGTDRQDFGRELVAWITANYPGTIRNMEMLGRQDGRYSTLAEATLPQLRDQLNTARDLAQELVQAGTGDESQQSRRGEERRPERPY